MHVCEVQHATSMCEAPHASYGTGPYTGGMQGGALAPPFQINDIQLAHLKNIPSLKFLMHIFTFLITFSN